ncbi:hypothetical protein [Pseudomonas typographi]|uniref:Uncharacterized protein n=1 Tax=Pseudomonas typographi TaxID=2715964 RepID=A0ABR7Z8T8_9PSED|nr:hypothetical protein [Pseudomonas typographi]MBD1555027.1 hypothetical protein [Pseudomonas typographi]MBD1601970.1 hypothetical protein [Pseudomonas typographi]
MKEFRRKIGVGHGVLRSVTIDIQRKAREFGVELEKFPYPNMSAIQWLPVVARGEDVEMEKFSEWFDERYGKSSDYLSPNG